MVSLKGHEKCSLFLKREKTVLVVVEFFFKKIPLQHHQIAGTPLKLHLPNMNRKISCGRVSSPG